MGLVKNIRSKSILKGMIITCTMLVGSLIFLIFQWPQPTLEWSVIEKMASEYMEKCTAQQDQSTHLTGTSHGINVEKTLPMEGIVVVITGATSGIGQSLAAAVHRLGSTVVVIGRSSSKLQMLEDQFKNKRIVTVLGDNADLESMSKAADTIKAQFTQIDFLINNAGMHYHNTENPLFWKPTKQGYDWLFTVNYLSHFLLTEKLIPLLQKSRHKPRVIQVSSSYHWKVDGSELAITLSPSSTTSKTNLSSISAPQASRFDIRSTTQCRRSYANSKFAQILHARALSRRLKLHSSPFGKSVRVLSICPSWVATHISDGKGLFQDLIHRFALRSDGPGIRSILNAMLLANFDAIQQEENEELDFLTNTVDFFKWSIYENLGLLTEFARERGVRDIFSDLFFSFQIPFQNMFHRELMIEKSAPETYNVTLQDMLYEWSYNTVKDFI